MANEGHLKILKLGVAAWNEWRDRNPSILPILGRTGESKPDLSSMDLRGADLSFAYLWDVNLKKADLGKADLSYATLNRANLSYADLRGAKMEYATLTLAKMGYARLGQAALFYANLTHASLSRADLNETLLLNTNFNSAKLNGTDFTNATLAYTNFSNTDLGAAKGLESTVHRAPSSIGVDTLYLSKGNIPEIFLRGCGVPEDFITSARSLRTKTMEFHSCFISYSSQDQEFAERLHADLQARGVRVWFAPHDLPIGARIRPAIDESIRGHDKLLLVLSEASVSSQWVEQEVETALAREREPGGKTVLFPVRLDDAVLKSSAGWPALLKNTRNIGDFTLWKEPAPYGMALDRLLRDLKAGA